MVPRAETVRRRHPLPVRTGVLGSVRPGTGSLEAGLVSGPAVERVVGRTVPTRSVGLRVGKVARSRATVVSLATVADAERVRRAAGVDGARIVSRLADEGR